MGEAPFLTVSQWNVNTRDTNVTKMQHETVRLRRFVDRTIRSVLTHTFYAQGIAREARDGLGPGGRQLKFRIRSWGEQKQRWTERRMEAFLAGDWD